MNLTMPSIAELLDKLSEIQETETVEFELLSRKNRANALINLLFGSPQKTEKIYPKGK